MKALSIGSFESFWKAGLLISGLVAWSLPAWNVIVNPYGIFKTKYSMGSRYTSSTTNERYLKTEHLLNLHNKSNPDSASAIVSAINAGNRTGAKETYEEFDGLIVGSSIMGIVDPSIFNEYFPDRRFYNLAFLAAKPDEILETLKSLKREGVPVKSVVYGLEPIAFTDSKSYGPAYHLHPNASGQKKERVVFDYLFASSLYEGFSRLTNVMNGSYSVRYDIEGTGRYFLERYDQEIQLNHAAFVRQQFPIEAKTVSAPPWIESRFNDFGALIRWLQDQKVEYTIYLNPLHPFVVSAYGESRLSEFKEKINNLAGDKVNDCTKILMGEGVNRRFYDYKHFRDVESEQVVACAMQQKRPKNRVF